MLFAHLSRIPRLWGVDRTKARSTSAQLPRTSANFLKMIPVVQQAVWGKRTLILAQNHFGIRAMFRAQSTGSRSS